MLEPHPKNRTFYFLEHAALLQLETFAGKSNLKTQKIQDALIANETPLSILSGHQPDPVFELIQAYRENQDRMNLVLPLQKYLSTRTQTPEKLMLGIILGIDVVRACELSDPSSPGAQSMKRALIKDAVEVLRTIRAPSYWATVFYHGGKAKFANHLGWGEDRTGFYAPETHEVAWQPWITLANQQVARAAQYEVLRDRFEREFILALQRGLLQSFPSAEGLIRGYGRPQDVLEWGQEAAARGTVAKRVRRIVEVGALDIRVASYIPTLEGYVQDLGFLVNPVLATARAMMGDEICAPVNYEQEILHNHWGMGLVCAHLLTKNPILESVSRKKTIHGRLVARAA